MKIYKYETLPSSNTFLKDNYSSYNNEDVILVNRQTNGRGRFLREWVSDNDLTFSILFKNCNLNHGLIAPLSIIQALDYFGYKALIKWPNDIYLDNKKLCGILIESVYSGQKQICQIVGIGINLTSKAIELNANYVNINKELLLNKILESYSYLQALTNNELLKEYKNNSLLKGFIINYHNEKYEIKDFTNNLELICVNENKIISINASEIDIKASIIR